MKASRWLVAAWVKARRWLIGLALLMCFTSLYFSRSLASGLNSVGGTEVVTEAPLTKTPVAAHSPILFAVRPTTIPPSRPSTETGATKDSPPTTLGRTAKLPTTPATPTTFAPSAGMPPTTTPPGATATVPTGRVNATAVAVIDNVTVDTKSSGLLHATHDGTAPQHHDDTSASPSRLAKPKDEAVAPVVVVVLAPVKFCTGLGRRKAAYLVYDPSGNGSRPDVVPTVLPKSCRPNIHRLAAFHQVSWQGTSDQPPPPPRPDEKDAVRLGPDGHWRRYWHRRSAEPSRDSGTCTRANAVIAFAMMLGDGPRLVPLVRSFQRHASPCDALFVFSDSCPMPIPVERSERVAAVHCITLGEDDVMGSPETARIVPLTRWVRTNWRRYDYILHVDARDTFFFEDPFSALYDMKMVGVFAAAERRSIADESAGQTRMWMASFSAASSLQDGRMLQWLDTLSLGGEPFPVICSGVYGGSSLAMADLVMTFSIALNDAPPVVRSLRGVDQGVLMYLFVLGLNFARFRHRVWLFDPYLGPITHHINAGDVSPVTPLGAPTNCHFGLYAVAHQVDRHQGWCWKLNVAFRPATDVNTVHAQGALKFQQHCHEAPPLQPSLLPSAQVPSRRGTVAAMLPPVRRMACRERAIIAVLLRKVDSVQLWRLRTSFRQRFGECTTLALTMMIDGDGAGAMGARRRAAFAASLTAHAGNVVMQWAPTREALAGMLQSYDVALLVDGSGPETVALSGGVLGPLREDARDVVVFAATEGSTEPRRSLRSLQCGAVTAPVFVPGKDEELAPSLVVAYGRGAVLGAAVARHECGSGAHAASGLIGALWTLVGADRRRVADSRSERVAAVFGPKSGVMLSRWGRLLVPCDGRIMRSARNRATHATDRIAAVAVSVLANPESAATWHRDVPVLFRAATCEGGGWCDETNAGSAQDPLWLPVAIATPNSTGS